MSPTTAAPCISYRECALNGPRLNQTRLPSSAEYDAIRCGRGTEVKRRWLRPVRLSTWMICSTTSPSFRPRRKPIRASAAMAAARHLRDMHVLKGFQQATNAPFELLPWAEGAVVSRSRCRIAQNKYSRRAKCHAAICEAVRVTSESGDLLEPDETFANLAVLHPILHA